MAIEALPQGLTQEDMMKLITHPTFRAAVERQVHAKLVALGVTQPGPIVAVHQGNPMPLPQTRPPKMVPVKALEPKPEPVEKLTAKQAHAKAMGWVATKDVLRVLIVSRAYVTHLVKRSLLRGAAHGYYTAESLERTRQYMMENGIGTEGHAQQKRKPRVFAPVDIPEGYATPDVLAAERGLRPKSLAQYVRLHRLPYKVLAGASPKGCFVVERKAFEAQLERNPMRPRRARKLAS